MYRVYINDNRYRRIFKSRWTKTLAQAERLLEQEYKRHGFDPAYPNVYGFGIEEEYEALMEEYDEEDEK